MFHVFRQSYTLIVQARDKGSPSLHTQTTVIITVGDANDNSPVFQGLPYVASVPEDHDTTTPVLQVIREFEPQYIYTVKNEQIC